MARIQGNTYDGLKAIYDRFGDDIELNIIDKPNGNENSIKYAGWQHLDVLKSQGTEQEINERLKTHLLNHYTRGEIDYECFKQSAGSDERARQIISSMAGPHNRGTQENGNRREISSGSRQESHTQQGRNSSPESQAHTHITNSQTKPNLSTQNTYINCPYTEKDQAKSLGAKWDNTNKSWYVPTGLDLSKFEKWLTSEQEKSAKTPTNQQNKIYLYTTPEDINQLQELKAQGVVAFDITHKVWYAKEADNPAVKQWLNRPNIPTPQESFADYLKANGIAVVGEHPILDGRAHRISNKDSADKKHAQIIERVFVRTSWFSSGYLPSLRQHG